MIPEIDINEAIRYMGYRETPTDEQMTMINDCAELLKEQITPSWVYRLFGLERSEEGLTLSGTSLLLRGRSIAEHLDGCESCILLCATAGVKADELIRLKESENILLGVMTDALASAAAEAVCNAAEREIADRLPGRSLTWRFSPGYGDLPLDIQPQILDILDAGKRAGVTCTDSFLLIPRKSVTAVIGVADKPIEKKRLGCTLCKMRGNCSFRKVGEHCGA